MSEMPCWIMAMRSTPMPKAKPVMRFGVVGVVGGVDFAALFGDCGEDGGVDHAAAEELDPAGVFALAAALASAEDAGDLDVGGWAR